MHSSMSLIPVISKKETGAKSIIGALVSTLISIGAWGCFLTMFPLPYSISAIWILVAVTPGILYFLLITFRLSGVFILLVLAVCSAALYEQIWGSLLLIVNNVVLRINDINNLAIVPFPTQATNGTPALILLIASTSIGIAYGVLTRATWLTFLTSAPLVLFGLFYWGNPMILFLAILSCGWIGLAIPGARAAQTGMGAVLSAGVLSAVAMLFFGLTYIWFPISAYSPVEQVDNVSNEVLSIGETLRYEIADADVHQRNFGSISNAEELMYTGNTALYVYMQTPRPVFLRGFTGGQYENGEWLPLSEEFYSEENLGLFEWLAQNDFNPQFQLGLLGDFDREMTKAEVIIRNPSVSSRYVYTPYEAVQNGDLAESARAVRDQGLFSSGLFGIREYSFEMFQPIANDYGSKDFDTWLNLLRNANGYEGYLELERAYRAFVYSNYLSVPDSISDVFNRELSGGVMSLMRGRDYRRVVHYIRNYFGENKTYTLDTVVPVDGEDIIETFFREGSGYDIHFATVAALLLREAGVPTRYVEGFYLSPTEVGMYEEMPSVEFAIPDSLAHAWVEVYIDEIGWVPVEFTPGFFTLAEEFTDEMIMEDQLLQRPTYLYTEEHEIATEDGPVGSMVLNIDFSWWPILLIALFVAAIIYIVIGRIRIHLRKRTIVGGELRESVLAQFRYILKLLRFDGIKADAALAYATILPSAGKYNEERLNYCLDLAYSARYAGNAPFAYDVMTMRQHTDALAKQVYTGQKWYKKVAMRCFVFLY